MGIPAFYKWLTTRYEKTVVLAVEETPSTANGVAVPLRTSDPNPNGVEYDNLYLDMNNIIHPCFHSEDLPAPSSYEEVFQGVFKYVDKIFSIIRPRKLLYMAIDGVAPRAKMNQQRSRRFRAAKDAADEARNLGQSSGDVLELEGVTEEERWSKKLDSNVITPGTEFMDLLSQALRYYIHLRMNNDPGWRGIKVILSDATVPGEGEHKIMSYIRLQRNLPGYDPNTRHCLYGLDADLIMLALATHEVHFTILREDVRKNEKSQKNVRKMQRKRKRKLGQHKHNKGLSGTEKASDMLDRHISRLKFQLLNIWVLREYLAHDMRAPNSIVETELERLIDDFVFICLFVGNDFLPHVPSLEISEGAIDLLMAVYKKEFVQMGGYLTKSFEIDLSRLEHFIQAVGSHENAIFRKRHHMQKEQGARNKDFSMCQSGLKLSKLPLGDGGILPQSHELSKPLRSAARSFAEEQHGVHSDVDLVRLGEEGWKERYYAEKFDAESKDGQERARRHAVMKYMEGIAWVMRYYYEGVCSWDWFYPYHYAPFASDFCGLGQLEIKFSLGKPFKPFDQLMAVLPAASAHALPSLYRKLMTDPSSPLLDFYPSDIEIDMNGKRFSWQAICKLPFIEESRLLSEIAKVEHTLTEDERCRNSWGLDTLFVHIVHPLAIMVVAFVGGHNDVESLDTEVSIEIDPETSGGMNGYIKVTKGTLQPPEIYSPIDGMEMIAENKILTVLYELPHFHPHVPMLPEGVIFPDKLVKKKEMPHHHSLWHEMRSHHHISSRMPLKNAISGSRLARCAHILVSKVIPPKQQDRRGLFRPSYASGRLGVAEMKKRILEGLGKTKSLNGRSKGGNDHKDADPNKGSNPGELEGRCVNPDGYTLNGTTAEKKSEITKKREKRRVVDNHNVQGLEGIVLEENTLSPLCSTSCDLKEEKASADCQLHAPSDKAVEAKIDEKPKRKSKRRRVEENNIALNGTPRTDIKEDREPTFAHMELKTEGETKKKGRTRGEDGDKGQHLTSCDLNGEKASADCEHHTLSDKAVKANIYIRQVKENNIAPGGSQIMESCVAGEERLAFAHMELKTEGETKEKRQGKRKRGTVNNNIAPSGTQRTESCVVGEDRLVFAHMELNNNIAPSGSHRTESCVAGEDRLAFAHMELKTEGKTKKTRRGKRKRGTVDNNIAPSGTERTESCVAGEDRLAFAHIELNNNITPSGTQRTKSCVAGENRLAFAHMELNNSIVPSGTQRTESCVAGEDRLAFAHMELNNNIAPSGTQRTDSVLAGEDRLAFVHIELKTEGKKKKTRRGKKKRSTANNNIAHSGTQNTESCAEGEDGQPAFAHMELKTEGETKEKQGVERSEGTMNNIAPSGTQNAENSADGEGIHVLIQAGPDEVEWLTSSSFVEPKAGSDFPTGQTNGTESKMEGET